MRLRIVSLHSRRFSHQLTAIMSEFGHVIPWLRALQGIEHESNGFRVQHRLLSHFALKPNQLIALQLVTNDRSYEFWGGLLAMARSPEHFNDPYQSIIATQLEMHGAWYISCLQIAAMHRSRGIGTALMNDALIQLLNEHDAIWGVVSNPKLLSWYRSLGAKIYPAVTNDNGLWIVQWER